MQEKCISRNYRQYSIDGLGLLPGLRKIPGDDQKHDRPVAGQRIIVLLRLEQMLKVLAVAALDVFFGKRAQLFGIDKAVSISHFFNTTDLGILALFNYPNELSCIA